MTTLRYCAQIEKPLEDVYALAAQVERHPEFIPDYLSCRVLAREERGTLLERSARVRDRIVSWKSWVRFEGNKALHFVHEGGALDGMRVTWDFETAGAGRTHMTISQEFRVRGVVGFFLEKWVFKPKLQSIARRVIQNFKRACEAS